MCPALPISLENWDWRDCESNELQKTVMDDRTDDALCIKDVGTVLKFIIKF